MQWARLGLPNKHLCFWEVLGRLHKDDISQLCTWEWFNTFRALTFDWQVPLFLLFKLLLIKPLQWWHSPFTAVTKRPLFVSANALSITKIFSLPIVSKMAVNKRFKYVLLLCHHDYNTSSALIIFKGHAFSELLQIFPSRTISKSKTNGS